MSISAFKLYKKLINELKFRYSELEYVKDECNEGNKEFENYYRSFCSKNNISISELESKNKKKVEQYFGSKIPTSTEGEKKIVDVSLSDEQVKSRKIFQRIFHGIAKKIHPDKFSGQQKTVETFEKEELFKKASYAFDNEKWGILLEIAEELDIRPQKYEKINDLLRDEISDVNKEIVGKQKTFGWRLYNAPSEHEKDHIIISFLKTVFNYNYRE